MSRRYNEVLSRLPETVEWSVGLDINKVSRFLLEDDGLPRVFLGCGGSLSAAYLSASLSVERGIVAVAMTPYQFIFSPWAEMPARVVVISAGGSNVDVLNSCKTSMLNPKQKFAALLMSIDSPLERLMSENGLNDSFVFELRKRDGFVATNSLVAFYSILFRIFRAENAVIKDWSFIEKFCGDFKVFVDSTYSLPTETWDQHNAALYNARETDRFYILYSPETLPVAVDLESRFSEGAIGCLQISDYRNFSHGRFNWFSQRKGQTAIIALINRCCKGVAEGILSELPDYIPVFRLETEKDGSESIMHLLIKGMFLSRVLGERWGLDLGAPKVPDFGRVIFKKDYL